PPFRAEGTHAVLRRVIDDTPRPIQEVNPEIPASLCDLVARLHAKNPADRFQSAREVAELLRQHLAHLQQPGQMASPGAAEKPPSARPDRKRGWAGLVAAALLLALGGFLLLAYRAGWLSRSSDPAHTPVHGPVTDGSDKGKTHPIAEKKAVAPEVLDGLQ